jgi:very-short-patch-repair endonuclease
LKRILIYNPKLTAFAKKLRNNSTKSEIKLWQFLKNDKMLGYDFHRQKPIGNYIYDFFCYELMLAIELDGITHQFEETYLKDVAKENYANSVGVHLIRFSDNEVMKDIEGVIRSIENKIYLIESKRLT